MDHADPQENLSPIEQALVEACSQHGQAHATEVALTAFRTACSLGRNLPTALVQAWVTAGIVQRGYAPPPPPAVIQGIFARADQIAGHDQQEMPGEDLMDGVSAARDQWRRSFAMHAWITLLQRGLERENPPINDRPEPDPLAAEAVGYADALVKALERRTE